MSLFEPTFLQLKTCFFFCYLLAPFHSEFVFSFSRRFDFRRASSLEERDFFNELVKNLSISLLLHLTIGTASIFAYTKYGLRSNNSLDNLCYYYKCAVHCAHLRAIFTNFSGLRLSISSFPITSLSQQICFIVGWIVEWYLKKMNEKPNF